MIIIIGWVALFLVVFIAGFYCGIQGVFWYLKRNEWRIETSKGELIFVQKEARMESEE